jgi:hypothetical protein
MMRPERDARAHIARSLEVERGGRVQDLENERDARPRETSDLRAAIQRFSERLATYHESPICGNSQVMQEVECSLVRRQESMERRLCELVPRVRASASQTQCFGEDLTLTQVPIQLVDPRRENNTQIQIKEELEELGYETQMIFVDTSDEASKERNSLLSRMMMESVRQDKWAKSQRNTKYFTEAFKDFVPFDNTGDIGDKEQDIHEVYELTRDFLDSRVTNETAFDWLQTNHKSYVNYKIDSLFKEEKDAKISNKFIQKNRTRSQGGSGTNSGSKRFLNDNNSPVQQLARKFGKQDDIRDGDLASNSSYIFRTYEGQEPTLKVLPQAKEPNFQKDKEKVKAQKNRTFNDVFGDKKNQGIGIGSTFNGRAGLAAGLGDQTHSEQKDFSSFRKEAIDDPGANDMGVGGTLNGATNKEPLVTPADNKIRANDIKKKKK